MSWRFALFLGGHCRCYRLCSVLCYDTLPGRAPCPPVRTGANQRLYLYYTAKVHGGLTPTENSSLKTGSI